MASFILLLLLLLFFFFYEISFILPKVGLMGHFKTKSSIFEGFFSFLQIFSSNLQSFWKLYLIKGIKKWENMDFLTFTGYLYHKTITSQDVPSKAQIKNFLYGRRIVSFSRYSRFCIFNHQMIYQICDVTMSISRISHIGGVWRDAPHHMIFSTFHQN